MSNKILFGLMFASLLLMGCTCSKGSLSACSAETSCNTNEGYWCDDNEDGTFNCQTAACTLGNLTETSELESVVSEEDLGNLDQLDTNANSGGLPDLGSL